MKVKLKAYKKFYEDLQKLENRAKAKLETEKFKRAETFIMLKGVECYNEADIMDVYAYGDCSSKERDKAIEKLKKKLNQDDNGETETDIYLKVLNNYMICLANEIADIKFMMLPIEEQTRLLEERNKKAGVDY